MEELRNDRNDGETLEQFFLKFLNNRADLLHTVQYNKNANKTYTPYTNTVNNQKNKTFTVTTNNNRSNNYTISCALCKQSHHLFTCQLFRDLDVDTRIQKVNGYSICQNCLRPGHKENKCKLSHCKYCKEKHNTLLHKDVHTETIHSENVVLSTNIVQTSSQSHILLSTALVQVSDAQGRLHTARLLLDNGSTSHFITRQLCEKLGLVIRNTNSTISGINNQLTVSAESCNLTIKSRSSDYGVRLNCYILPNITQSLPSTYINTDIQLPPGIQLADPSFNVPNAVQILVGAEIFWDVLGSNTINLGKRQPKLQETKLGWIVTGVIHQDPVTHNRNTKIIRQNPSCFLTQCENTQLTRFWELESVSPRYSQSAEERFCEESFNNNTRRDSRGRFVVTIPLKESPEVLGDSYMKARSQFLSLERRLQRDETLKQRYADFMHEYILLGHMEENKQKTESKSYYLPHHGITRESSSTTKLRVVFNASASTSTGKSYNEIQCIGPVVQEDLYSILLRFRQHKYVVTGDIEKMYRAILVTPEQRSLQQILFRFNTSDPLKCYKLNTVTYGTASAPYLATKCLASLSNACSDHNASLSIQRDFYVDDYLSGGDTIESIKKQCQIVKEVLESAHFNLRKWQSNNIDLLRSITTDKKLIDTEKSLNLNQYQPCKTLGLNWDTISDMFLFTIQIKNNDDKITKRNVLSLTSQVFDPLGLLGPCTVRAKLIIQQLWKIQCGWDDEIPEAIKKEFIDFIDSYLC
ncbi:uncharacterized protein LOC131842451 [Achroia grisella]|uniref:uncharacterized protein LOC131842451 n=1 Tax=Achroia grisella TaxID=688607 RepID=UPI0027D2058A|nr:uncharacterized protein LOC131842451 [Achroia grisella]